MMTYKRSVSVFVALAVITVAGVTVPLAVNSKIITNVDADISAQELRAVVVDDFESGQVAADISADGWFIKSTPKQYKNADTEKKLKRKNPVPVLQMKYITGGPNDMAVEQWSLTGLGMKKEKCLGVNFKFRYPGFNSVHMVAPKEVDWQSKKPVMRNNPSTGKEEQERGIQLPGQARAISLWVHGRGNPYDLEIWVKDYRGDTYILKAGSVNFVGWRPMRVEIPVSVPQSYESYPQTRVTKLTEIVLRAQMGKSAEELTEDTFFFFDQIKVLTDTYEVNFDGSDLHKLFENGGEQQQPKPQN